MHGTVHHESLTDAAMTAEVVRKVALPTVMTASTGSEGCLDEGFYVAAEMPVVIPLKAVVVSVMVRS